MAAAVYCDVALPVPLHETFTYHLPPQLRQQVCVGGRVVVPFRQRKLVGIVTALTAEPRYAAPLRDVLEVVDTEPLLPPLLAELARWMTDYYQAPAGEIFRVMLPLHGEFAQRERARLRPLGVERLQEVERRRPREKSAAPILFEGDWGRDTVPVLTSQQQRALEEIEQLLAAGGFASVVLHGVTGSGKTEVYLRAIQVCLDRGRTALLLVPEIALTPAVAELFAARFGDRVAVLHSGLGTRERSTEWWRLRRGA